MTFHTKGQGPKFPRPSKYKQARRSILVCVGLILVIFFLYAGITKSLNNNANSLASTNTSSHTVALVKQKTTPSKDILTSLHDTRRSTSKPVDVKKATKVTPPLSSEKEIPSAANNVSSSSSTSAYNPALPRMLASTGLPPVYAAESTAWGQPFVGFGIEEISAIFVEKYGKLKPKEWGEKIPGVVSKVHKDSSPVVVLTLDACGGKKGSSYDAKLIEFLKENNIPATLFISSQWIVNNRDIFTELSQSPLFEIASHGLNHRPLSVEGRNAYGIKGTSSIEGVVEEVEKNTREIHRLTTKRPQWFRSGTAYYDDISIKIVHDLDLRVAGYTLSVDQGATLSAKSVERNMLSVKNGDIILAHMNHPESGTRAGILAAIPLLLERGYTFKTLSEAVKDN